MKKVLLVVIGIILVGCYQYNPDGSIDSSSAIDMKTFAIDSCEYISAYNRLAHKGNCKYCRERRKKELEEFTDSIKNFIEIALAQKGK